MRTTLKRGIGRGAAFNGNGHAVLPPAPVTAAPQVQQFRRYVQPPPPVRTAGRLIGAIVGYVVLGLVTVGGGVLAGVYLSTQETLKDLRPPHARLIAATPPLKALSQPNAPPAGPTIGSGKRG